MGEKSLLAYLKRQLNILRGAEKRRQLQEFPNQERSTSKVRQSISRLWNTTFTDETTQFPDWQ